MNDAWLLAAMAAAPGLAISIYIYWKDRFEKEPKWLLVKCFLYGMLSTVPAVIFSYAGTSLGLDPASPVLWHSLLSCVVGIGLAEEFAKFIFIKRFAYRSPHFNEPFDGITYSVIVSMGFATLENFLYVFQYGFETAVVRMFLSVPAHAIFGVIIGYYLGIEKHYNKPGAGYIGLAIAATLHGLFDFFLFNEHVFGSISGALLSFIIGLRYSFKAIKIHSEASPFIQPGV